MVLSPSDGVSAPSGVRVGKRVGVEFQAFACASAPALGRHTLSATARRTPRDPIDSALMIDSVVFDLDGTLWDTTATCAVGWNNVVRRLGITFRDITEADIRAITGLPQDECVRRVFGDMSELQIAELIDATAVEDVRLLGELGGRLYDGVREGIPTLAASVPLFIVSNCQAGYIETFLRTSGLQTCFSGFECWGNTGLPKGANLGSLIRHHELLSPVLVGDTFGDMTAARECGIPFIHAEWGFGECHGVDRSFASFDALSEWLLTSPQKTTTGQT